MHKNYLSIITINLNNLKGLEKTLKSVSSQTFDYFEHIVIDGESTDGSVDILKKSNLSKLKYLSQKDSGIYNAMNKGINMSQGRYCLFLNSGDYLTKNTILTEIFSTDFDEDLICGDVYFEEKHRLIPGSSVPAKPSLEYLIYSAIPHPAIFIKRSFLVSLGGYNEGFTIVSDWEFFLKAIVFNNATYRRVPYFVSVFDLKGISSQPKYQSLIREERKKALENLLPNMVIRQLELNHAEVMEYRKLKKNFFLRKLFRIMK